MRNVLKEILYLPGMQQQYKRTYFIGILAYIIMLAFSIIFYRERIILLDTANNVFYFAANNTFAIGIFRFGNALNQLLPVLAVKAGASLDAIMILYSVSFHLYYFSCYLICGSVFKRYDFALVILLLNILFISHTFYWVVSELPLSMALLLVLLAMLGKRDIRSMTPLVWIAAAAITVTIAFFHPLCAFAVVCATAFLYYRRDIFADKRLLQLFTASFFITVLVKAIFFRTPYEQHSLSGLRNFVVLFPNYLNTFSNRQFIEICGTHFYWIPVLFAATIIFYIKNKKWLQLAFFIASFFGYLMLVNVSYPGKETPVFYIENLYTPLALILAFPFIFELLPLLTKRNLQLPVVALILVTGTIRVYATHNTYTNRLNWERNFIKVHGEKKLVYPSTLVPMDTLMMEWGTPYEFWLLSTTEQKKTASLIIDKKPELRLWAAGLKKSMVVNWNIKPYADLDPKYFIFTDTITSYEIIRN